MMKLHEFENLWARREELSPQQRAELERFAQSDRFARSFVQKGESVRSLMRGFEGERAPEGFAYRMRVYAANHRDESVPVPVDRRAWLRWPAMSMGLVAGAMLVLFAFGPMLGKHGQVPSAGMAEDQANQVNAAPEVEKGLPETAVAQDDLAENSDSLSAQERTQDRGPRAQESLPDWDLHTVSTGDN
ncbi:MAG: hypothetical protein V2A56_00635 [bacterium]